MTYVRKFINEFKEQQEAKTPAEKEEEGKYDDVKMVEGEEDTRNQQEISEQEMLDSMRYEYYIHYLGIDRRNDRWVTE